MSVNKIINSEIRPGKVFSSVNLISSRRQSNNNNNEGKLEMDFSRRFSSSQACITKFPVLGKLAGNGESQPIIIVVIVKNSAGFNTSCLHGKNPSGIYFENSLCFWANAHSVRLCHLVARSGDGSFWLVGYKDVIFGIDKEIYFVHTNKFVHIKTSPYGQFIVEFSQLVNEVFCCTFISRPVRKPKNSDACFYCIVVGKLRVRVYSGAENFGVVFLVGGLMLSLVVSGSTLSIHRENSYLHCRCFSCNMFVTCVAIERPDEHSQNRQKLRLPIEIFALKSF